MVPTLDEATITPTLYLLVASDYNRQPKRTCALVTHNAYQEIMADTSWCLPLAVPPVDTAYDLLNSPSKRDSKILSLSIFSVSMYMQYMLYGDGQSVLQYFSITH